MKKLSITMIVLLTGAHLVGKAQYVVRPYMVASIPTVQSFKLPPLIKPVDKSKPQGVGPSTNYVCTGTCSIALPVTLLQLLGNRLNDNQVMLNWKTQNETNSKGFDMERSLDGGMTFSVVGTAASDTTKSTEKQYAQIDLNSYAQTSYYRIKQLDIDGRFTYSNTIAVTGYNVQQKVMLSPNPATTFTVLNCFASSSGKGNVVITSAHGQKLTELPWVITAGGNTLTISLAKYAAGFYYVQLIWPDGHNSVMKLVVR